MIATKLEPEHKIPSWSTKNIPWENFNWYNEENYFPLKNVIKYEGGISLCVGIRNDGKTFGLLEFMREDFEKNGHYSILIYNSEKTIKTMRENSISMNRAIYPENWTHYRVGKDGIEYIPTGETVIYIMSIHAARSYKGGRIANIKRIAIDEFNRFDEKIKKKYPEMIDELLVTFAMNKADVEFILFGNALTVNHRLLVKWGIMKLPLGISHKPFGNGHNILIYNYKRAEDQLDKRYAGNWVYDFTKETGSFEHNFANKMLADDSDYILEKIPKANQEYVSTFKYDNTYFNILKIVNINEGDKPIYWIEHEEEFEEIKDVIAGTKKDISNNMAYQREFKEMLLSLIEQNILLFSNQFVKDSVYELCRK